MAQRQRTSGNGTQLPDHFPTPLNASSCRNHHGTTARNPESVTGRYLSGTRPIAENYSCVSREHLSFSRTRPDRVGFESTSGKAWYRSRKRNPPRRRKNPLCSILSPDLWPKWIYRADAWGCQVQRYPRQASAPLLENKGDAISSGKHAVTCPTVAPLSYNLRMIYITSATDVYHDILFLLGSRLD